MDPKLVCASFRPNPPLTLAAHFDAVTRGQAKSVGMLSIYHLDDVLRAIDSRPDPVEQAALLSELEDRFVAYAAPHGWLLPQALPSEAASADALTTFVVKDILGIAGASAHDKTMGVFKDQLKDVLKQGLNSRGKTSLLVLQLLWDLANAKSGEEAVRILGKVSVGSMGRWIKDPVNAAWVVKAVLKTGPVRPVVINRLAKMIAARLTWLEVSLSRLAWVVPWLTFLDLFLTPERIADDATERRLGFLTVYGRLFGHRAAQFRTLVQRCSGHDWKLKIPAPDALSAAIGRY
jgi:hypothetical protein